MTPPRRIAPQGNGWHIAQVSEQFTGYQAGQFFALSSVVFVSDEHLPPHWEYLLSFSGFGYRRLSDAEIKLCLKDFGAEDFQEDNHEPGVARKFWKAVEERYRQPCPCKDELVITEGDYQYSVKKEGS